MSRPFKLEITESEAELKKRLQHVCEAFQKEKLQMLWWMKGGQVKQQQETGDHFLHKYPKLNRAYFQEFLNWLSEQLEED